MTQIYEAMSKVMAEIKGVPKAGWNPSQKFAFRSIDDTVEVVHNALVKHGVMMVPNVVSCERQNYTTAKGSTMTSTILTVEFTFYATDGSAVTATMVGESSDAGDKSVSKAASMALKYALFQTFMIPTGETDPDSEVAPPRSDGMISVANAKKILMGALDGDLEAAKAAWGDRTEAVTEEELNLIIAAATN
jgi:ERF superfamily